jgi:hypothetical protein
VLISVSIVPVQIQNIVPNVTVPTLDMSQLVNTQTYLQENVSVNAQSNTTLITVFVINVQQNVPNVKLKTIVQNVKQDIIYLLENVYKHAHLDNTETLQVDFVKIVNILVITVTLLTTFVLLVLKVS